MECELRIFEGLRGGYRWFLGRINPFTDEQGHIIKWFGTLTDIHKQKEVEEALQQSRDELRLVAEALPQLVWVDFPDGRQEFANQRWSDYTGKTKGPSEEEDWLAPYHPDDHLKIRTLWHHALLTSRPYEVEARLREAKTGEYRWFLIRGLPVINTYGRVWRWLGTCTDIQKQKQTEEALRESETRFRHFMDANLLGMAISEEGVIREANEAFLSLLGYTRQDLAAGLLQWTTLVPPEYQEVSMKAKEESFVTGLLRPYEKEYLTKDGKRVPVLLGGTLYRRQPRSLLAFVLDLTANKEVERQKELFLGMTSHELKTPLTAIKGTLQFIRRRMKRLRSAHEQLPPEVNVFLTDLEKQLTASFRQVEIQTHLIDDLLDVSRITAKTLKLELHRCDLAKILRETIDDLRVTAPDRELLLDISERCSVAVLADRNRISQVITNYVTNALRYSASSQPIHIGLTIQDAMAQVWVRDNGPGLSQEDQQRIWQRFHQATGVPAQPGTGKGLGLGLYICQMLIAQHQGEVGVESAPGKGSTFWFTLPRHI